ncbi:hypothetical protein [Streptomyces sp. GbtcB6]|uniref:hypothetical protein n=1 Tax=Streptomyces sp. GbtcB6 TaxID=2824751 RepID=UPI001C2F7591|nr:hypothetical protein [Streptomyces sp. GbtcB6]
MAVTVSADTGALWATLLALAGLPAIGYALFTRLTGRGRKGAAPWRVQDDPTTWVGAGAAVAGHALAAVTVVGEWGRVFGFLTTAYIGGCVAGAFVYAYDTWVREGEQRRRALRPALLLVVPYAFALGFFGRIAG